MKNQELNINAGKIIISPSKLILGGPAIFITENINHPKERAGQSKSIPFARKRLRL